MIEKSLRERITRFILVFGLTLAFVYVLLPWVTRSFAPLNRMSLSLEESGINPSSYYYTDVEQVIESEQYLETVLGDNR
ncbi:MAG: hypothetical protein KKC20_15165 [Proteobacteria bacterium]|nr:hypothetical protein [Pseudomonadota bacterium]